MSWKPEVIADNSGQWVGNALRFATKQEAEAHVHNLMMRWTSVREIRVVESDEAVTHQWDDNLGSMKLTASPAQFHVAQAAPSTGSTRVGPPK